MTARLRSLPVPRHLPIRWRLALLYGALAASVLLLLGLVLYQQISSYVVDSTADRLRAQALRVVQGGDTLIANQSFTVGVPGMVTLPQGGAQGVAAAQPGVQAVPLPPEPPSADSVIVVRGDVRPDAYQAMARSLTTLDTVAAVLATDGSLKADGRDRPEDPLLPDPDQARVRRVATWGTEASYVDRAPDGTRMMVVLMPLRRETDGEIVGVLQLAGTLGSADALLTRLRLLLLLGLGGALGLSVLVGVPLTRAALRPLDRLVVTAEQTVASDLSRRPRLPHGRDEIGRLSAAIDGMLDRLDASFQAQRRFVADAAHELRTPLTAISGLIELLLLGADNEDRATRRRTLATVDRDLSRLTRLVNDLLALSRHDLAVPHERRPVDLTALVADIDLLTAELAPERAVILNRPLETLWVSGDADQLRQVLLNLADNARRHTPPGGAIRFSVQAQGRACEVTVADSGEGIAAEDLPRIFERFYRGGDRARSRAGGGAGLGLAIARAIAEAHGGTLTAASAPGRGATFTLTLPRIPAPVPAESPAPVAVPVA